MHASRSHERENWGGEGAAVVFEVSRGDGRLYASRVFLIHLVVLSVSFLPLVFLGVLSWFSMGFGSGGVLSVSFGLGGRSALAQIHEVGDSKCSSNGEVGTAWVIPNPDCESSGDFAEAGGQDAGVVVQRLGLRLSVSYLVMQRRGNARAISVSITSVLPPSKAFLASGTSKVLFRSALGAKKSMPHHLPGIRKAARGGVDSAPHTPSLGLS